MTVKLLIDGDILVYRMGFATQSKGEAEPFSHAAYLVKKTIADMKKKFNTTKIKIYLTATGKSNFRFDIAKTKPYKGNRDPLVNPNAPGKPIHYDQLRKYIEEQYNTEVIYGMEADDALGIEQCTLLETKEDEPIMCSLDKDLDMIPGKHYNFVTDKLYECKDPGMLYLTENKRKIYGRGLKWFYAQMLLGDSSDNIPGIKGFGPVKVYKYLNEYNTELDLWNKVQETYKEVLCDLSINELYDRLYEVADLLWIRRASNEFKSDVLKEWVR